MQSKTGKDTSGRGNSQYRKSIILRFLGGSKQDEVNSFLDMVFEPFRDYFTGTVVLLMMIIIIIDSPFLNV